VPFLEKQETESRQGGSQNPFFPTGKSPMQCGPSPPPPPHFLDIIMDQIVRCWLQFVITDDHDEAAKGLSGATMRDLLGGFYADDDRIAARNHQWLQCALNVLVALFQKIRFETNVDNIGGRDLLA